MGGELPSVDDGPTLLDLLPAGLSNPNVVVLHAYFDDSGDVDQAIVAIGGFVAPRDAWDTLFLPAWRQMLRRNKIPYFRMSEYESPWDEPYKNWSRDKKVQEITEVLSIIRRTARLGVCAALPMDDWRHFEAGFAKRGVTHPYHLCAFWAAVEIRKWRDETPSAANHPIAYFFERGSPGTGDLVESFKAMEKWTRDFEPGCLSFPTKTEAPALQAADVMAYEVMKQTRRKLGIDDLPTRRSLEALAQPPMEFREAILGAEWFERILAAWG